MSKKSPKGNKNPFYVIGIGASAGGLEAINQFLANVPEKSGFAYIIVQHLSPDYKSLLTELLSKHTHLRVIEAVNKMDVEPDRVYILPSKNTITVKGGKILLKEKGKMAVPNNTINIFFESLAKEYTTKAVGIILSGTGSDGTLGAKSIAAYNGIVLVQDPGTSTFDGMPNSAIASGVANLVLPPQNMYDELIDYIKSPISVRSMHLNARDNELLLAEILALVKKVTTQDFSYYKNPTLGRRLLKRMAELNIASLTGYLKYLNDNPNETKELVHHFLINVTHFFRDRDAFEIIQDKVIPAIFKDKKPGDLVKVWVAACSTGEEAYSLAILFQEYMEKENIADITVKIFATDIDKEALEVASKGTYPRAIIDHVTGQRIANYFDVEGDLYKIKSDIRKSVVFSYHDILKDPPFGRIDLVSCRNMLIYINPDSQKEILRKLHFALNISGYLFVGPSEHVDVIKPALEELSKKWRIFRCITKTRFFEQTPYQFSDKPDVKFGEDMKRVKNPANNLGELFMETLLEDSSYAGIFVDLNMDVKQAIGNYKSYLNFPESQFNFNLLKLIHPDLAIPLSTSCRKAIQDNTRILLKGVKISLDKEIKLVDVHIKPYLHHKHFVQQFIFIVFKEVQRKENPLAAPEKRTLNEEEVSRVEELEQELRETRENLQAVIEEMEATNEELQSSNEEMISTNEELQSTNEELQSLNEELHTVSAEHQLKIKELLELNDDLNNYFRNSESGQILVDKNLIIRKFTPSARGMVNLVSSDINRSLIDITTRFKDVHFIEDISTVIRTGVPLEKEISIEERKYLMRITPYEKHDTKTDGVVANFTDITRIIQLDEMMKAIFKTVPNGIFVLKAIRDPKKEIVDLEFTAANPAAEKALAHSRMGILGASAKVVFPNYREYFKIYKQVIETGRSYNYEYYNEHIGKWNHVVVVKLMDGVISIDTDITEKKKAADLVEKNYDELRKSLKLGKRAQ